MTTDLLSKVDDSVSWLQRSAGTEHHVAIVLGSGLGEFADGFPGSRQIFANEIPSYPPIGAPSHTGRLVFSNVGGVRLIAFQGRPHFYESGKVENVVFPILVCWRLGVPTLIITNAAGGIAPRLHPGDLMLISDIINLTGERIPLLRGIPSRPQRVISRRLGGIAEDVARQAGLPLESGIYAGLKGPSYETAAEIEMVKRLGGDAVGMSTVLESMMAAYVGMSVLGISCITNRATGTGPSKLDHAEVTEVASSVRHSFSLLLSRILAHPNLRA